MCMYVCRSVHGHLGVCVAVMRRACGFRSLRTLADAAKKKTRTAAAGTHVHGQRHEQACKQPTPTTFWSHPSIHPSMHAVTPFLFFVEPPAGRYVCSNACSMASRDDSVLWCVCVGRPRQRITARESKLHAQQSKHTRASSRLRTDCSLDTENNTAGESQSKSRR